MKTTNCELKGHNALSTIPYFVKAQWYFESTLVQPQNAWTLWSMVMDIGLTILQRCKIVCKH